MKQNELVSAMNRINLTESEQNRLIENCLRKSTHNKHSRAHKIVAVAAAFLVFCAITAFGVPYLRSTENGIDVELKNIMTITAYAADGKSSSELSDGVALRIPPANCFAYTTKEVNGEEITIITGMQAPELRVTGSNIEKVVYTAHNAMLFCEFDSLWHDADGRYVWSSSYAIAPSAEYSSWIADRNDAKPEELIRILDDLHQKRDLTAFYDQLYSEYANCDGLSGRDYLEAKERFDDKCREPIDFSQYILTLNPEISWWDYKNCNSEVMIIGIVNPENQPAAPVNESTITASAGDTVSWYLGTEELMNKYYHVDIDTLDLTEIYDIVDVTVYYLDGSKERLSVAISCSETGELSLSILT